MFPLCISDVISIQLILRCFFRLVCYTMVTVFCSTATVNETEPLVMDYKN